VIFRDDGDRRHLLDLFAETVERYRVELHAFVLMDTHWHLVTRTPDANLSASMQWLSQSYASWFNTRHGRKGTVFQRPFGSVPVENGAWAYDLSAYVHLNPLRIKAFDLSKRSRQVSRLGSYRSPSQDVVSSRLKRLREYTWSSYRAYAGYAKVPEWLCTDELWARACAGCDESPAKAYRLDLQSLLKEGGSPDRREMLLDAVAVGSSAFLDHVKDIASRTTINRETPVKRHLRERVSIEDVITAVCKIREQPWDEIGNRYGDPATALVMWAARRSTGLTLREIGEALGGKDYAAVAMAIKRFEQTLSKDQKQRRVASKVCELLNVKMSPQ
jgi:REP element-mobilizing transposase RayT